ncbi:MAG: transglycosylase SLT domain-containing protein [Acidobacteria bacterium]|nr:transglycosylase SLT domain-containing protein [Acidobacteriota bacterium]
MRNRFSQFAAVVFVLLALLLGGAAAGASPRSSRGRPPQADPAEHALLEKLSRALKEKDTAANAQQLAVFAKKHAQDSLGARAALALAFRDFSKKKYPGARRWLDQAQRDAVLREYVLYWSAQVERAAGSNARALALFEKHHHDFPESVMAPQTIKAIAELALAAHSPARALAAFEGSIEKLQPNDLLLLRARAREQAGKPLEAAADYLLLYNGRPLSDEAGVAEKRIAALRRSLGEKFPEVPYGDTAARAQLLFEGKRWKAARAVYETLAGEASGAAREFIQLRIAQCRIHVGVPIALLENLSFTDAAGAEAERLLVIAQLYRAKKNDAEMLAAVEQLAQKFPSSSAAAKALFLAGNYFWTSLDRARAVDYYRRLLDASETERKTNFSAALSLDPFPFNDAQQAEWRVAWLAYLERKPEAAQLLERQLRASGSPYVADALYFLGRLAEREGRADHARAYFLKLVEHFPRNYFGLRGAERLRALGPGLENSPEIPILHPPLLWLRAPLPVAPKLDAPIPDSVTERWTRARALRSIAFDVSAELEFRAAHAAADSPRLLLEAAKAAIDAGRYMPAVSTARQVYPRLEAYRWEDVPRDAWLTLYPLAYASLVEKYSAKNALDPMLVAGLIRQETVFQHDAVSHAGAVGLMQVLPSTGRRLAKAQKLRYARAKLFEPEYNLRLGTVYFRDLLKRLGSTEAALAAYNAGEDRVAAWQAERNYEEPAEFVESIPFTETREYVQIVLRNAEIYRRLYAANNGK